MLVTPQIELAVTRLSIKILGSSKRILLRILRSTKIIQWTFALRDQPEQLSALTCPF